MTIRITDIPATFENEENKITNGYQKTKQECGMSMERNHN
jgi:hypothetical protein